MAPVVAIVGRPNVGKSALFNRIVGRRIAIVHDQPGVTRDRVSAEAEWGGRPFTLIDTGGIGLRRGEKASDIITAAAVDQVRLAIEAAHVLLFVVNVQEGITPLDREVADVLRSCHKPILLVANKADHEQAAEEAGEFLRLGFDSQFPVSAIHGRGIHDLLTAALKLLPAPTPGPGTESATTGEEPSEAPTTPAAEDHPRDGQRPLPSREHPLKLAIVGRPNVGKSSIINALTQSDRVIVSPIPGTTRDAVDVPLEIHSEGRLEHYLLIDTAGLRKNRHAEGTIDFFSSKRTEDAIARCDIAVLVIDAESGITEQDKKIAGKIVEERKACIVVINKWDLAAEKVAQARATLEEKELVRKKSGKRRDAHLDKPMTTLAEFGEWVQDTLFFIDYAPVLFTSAHTGFQLDRLLDAVRYVADQLRQRIPTAVLNRTLNDAIERRQPVSSMGHRLKFYYATQIRQAPPTFLLFVNRDELFSDPYTKYLGDQVRAAFGYEGCPIILIPRARPKTIEPVRKFAPRTSGSNQGKPGKKRLSKRHASSGKRRPGRQPKRR